MKRHWIVCGWLAGGLVFTGAAFAGAGSEQQFAHIKARNTFGLKEPQRAPSPSPPVVPQAAVKVTGITTFLSPKRAILLIQPPGQREESRVLREGEKCDGVELQIIDVENDSVVILNNGRPMTLSMARDGGR